MSGPRSLSYKSRKILHIFCRRCGSKSFHIRKRICSSCNFNTRR